MLSHDDEQFSHDQVRKPNLQTKVVAFHSRMTQCEEQQLKDWKHFWSVRAYRYAMLLIDGFKRTELTRRAAALTYTTILSIFPLLAVLTSVVSIFYTEAKRAELTSVIERTLLPSTNQVLNQDRSRLTPTERQLLDQQKQFADGIRKMFNDVSDKFRDSAGGVGIFGFIGVLVTAGLLYHSIESVVNQTWQTGAGRWTDTVRNFVLVLLFAPIVIGLSMTASTMAATLFGQQEVPPEEASAQVDQPAGVKAADGTTTGTTTAATVARPRVPIEPSKPSFLDKVRKFTSQFSFVIKVMPLILNILILSLAYSFLPNAKVSFKAAITGGIVAAGLWELARYLFFFYVYMSSANRTLADALGLSVIFLIWVYITWMILLLGNLVVYVTHNYRSLWAERRGGGEMMLDGRLLVATMLLIARRFRNHAPGYTETDIRERLSLRKEEFEQIISRLKKAGFVVRLESGSFALGQPAEDIRVADVLAMGCNLTTLPVVQRIGPVASTLGRLQDETIQAAGDRRLSDLLV